MTTTLLDNGSSRSCVSDNQIALLPCLMILIPGDDEADHRELVFIHPASKVAADRSHIRIFPNYAEGSMSHRSIT